MRRSKFSNMNTRIAVVIASLITAAGIFGIFTISETVFAQLTKDPGASGLTPKEDPQIPGWDPNGAEEDAPGQEAQAPTTCIACVKDLAPGQEGLKSGIIGPD